MEEPMKRFLLTATILLAASGVAAQTGDQLETQLEARLAALGLDADVSALDSEQRSTLYLILTSAASPAERLRGAEAILSGAQVSVPQVDILPGRQLEAQVSAGLTALGLDADLSALDQSDRAELYLILTSSSSPAERRREAKAVLSGAGALPGDADSLRAMMPGRGSDIRFVVQDALDRHGYSVDASSLSDEQVAALFLLVTSQAAPVATEVEAILN
jgi:hypothetical protein